MKNEHVDMLEDVIRHGLNFCESAMAQKDFELYAMSVHRAWEATKQRMGAILLMTTLKPTDREDVFNRMITVEVEVKPGIFVPVIREVQDNHISHIVEPRGIQKAIEEAQ